MQEISASSTPMEGHCTLTTRWQLDYFKRERRRQILISYREEGLFFTAFKHGLILINFMQPKYRTWGRSKHSRIRAQNGDLLQVQVFSTTPPLRYTYILGIPKQISPLSFSNTQNSSVHCSGGRGVTFRPASTFQPTFRTVYHQRDTDPSTTSPPLQLDRLANHDEANERSM